MPRQKSKHPPVLNGEVFGKWTVVVAPKFGGNDQLVECRCVCGTERRLLQFALRRGRTHSCGCGKAERLRQYHAATKQRPALKGRKLFQVWKSMIARCSSVSHPSYPDYGGRGITVCAEWRASFGAFEAWALASGYRAGLAIDRINNCDGGSYSPDNCRFVTQKQNNRNRRSNCPVTAFGETKIIVEWAEDQRCAVSEAVLRSRLKLGWQPERAMTETARRRTA
jgi:hypothetical protein